MKILKNAVKKLDISQFVGEDELEDLAELLNYPLREHQKLVEEHTDQELEIQTFSGQSLEKLFSNLGFEKGMEKLALLLKEEIDKGHSRIEEELEGK